MEEMNAVKSSLIRKVEGIGSRTDEEIRNEAHLAMANEVAAITAEIETCKENCRAVKEDMTRECEEVGKKRRE